MTPIGTPFTRGHLGRLSDAATFGIVLDAQLVAGALAADLVAGVLAVQLTELDAEVELVGTYEVQVVAGELSVEVECP